MDLKRFADRTEFIEHLKESGTIVWASGPGSDLPNDSAGGRQLLRAEADGSVTAVDGLSPVPSGLVVSEDLYRVLNVELAQEDSEFRRLSSRPSTRAFVFLDISDFSKMPSGGQLLVVSALIRLVADPQQWASYSSKGKFCNWVSAQLCIGDGYVYVLPGGLEAIYFAGFLAQLIETRAMQQRIPEFHFRIGAHVGPVRCFWDPGRKDWNYVGDGINGGSRVLSAIGKETDDVVYVSSAVRQCLLEDRTAMDLVFPHLENKGRKVDKHGQPWRVYQLNHGGLIRMVEDTY